MSFYAATMCDTTSAKAALSEYGLQEAGPKLLPNTRLANDFLDKRFGPLKASLEIWPRSKSPHIGHCSSPGQLWKRSRPTLLGIGPS